MRASNSILVAAFINATLMTACGRVFVSTPASVATQAAAPTSRLAPGTEQVLYSFKGGKDGAYPEAGLIDVNGTLYGTTSAGGSHDNGTVLISAPAKRASCIASFGIDDADGANPTSRMIAVNGALYGNTSSGGLGCISSSCTSRECGYGSSSGCGTIFKVSTSGSERIIYRFKNGRPDGLDPLAGFVDVKGTLYGTTSAGGSRGQGTVIATTTSGRETVLHSFKGGSQDGAEPWAALIDVDGTLYGTTELGGTNNYGAVFSISLSRKEAVIYSFKAGSDGAYPLGDLIDVKGTLYGTTSGGGTHHAGTVFSLSRAGKEKVLYSFKGVPDGEDPNAGLTTIAGALYGTTYAGGSRYCNNSNFRGCGVVFKLTLTGKEQVLHRFQGGTADGTAPFAPLIAVGGMLYGTASEGGTSNNGEVYEVTP